MKLGILILKLHTYFYIKFELFEVPVDLFLSGRFKSKETDFEGFITKIIHISRFVNQIFMFFMSKNLQHSVVLEYVFAFYKNRYFYCFDGVYLEKIDIF